MRESARVCATACGRTVSTGLRLIAFVLFFVTALLRIRASR